MKRGLKVIVMMASFTWFLAGLNEKRIESSMSRQTQLRSLPLMPQWKEDWKCMPLGNTCWRRDMCAPQWKEDWKISMLISTTTWCSPASMKRGLKVAPILHAIFLASSCLNEKRIERCRKYSTKWSCQAKASMKRGLKVWSGFWISLFYSKASMKRGLKDSVQLI